MKKTISDIKEFSKIRSVYLTRLASGGLSGNSHLESIKLEDKAFTKYSSQISATRMIFDEDINLIPQNTELLPVDVNHLIKSYRKILLDRGCSSREILLEFSGLLALFKKIFLKYGVPTCEKKLCEMKRWDIFELSKEIFDSRSSDKEASDVFLYGRSYTIANSSSDKEKSEAYWVYKEALEGGAKRFLLDRTYFEKPVGKVKSKEYDISDEEWKAISEVKEIVVLDSSISLDSITLDEFKTELNSSLASSLSYNLPSIGFIWSGDTSNKPNKFYFINYQVSCSKCELALSFKEFSLKKEEYQYKLKGYSLDEVLSLSLEDIKKIVPEEYHLENSYLILSELVIESYDFSRKNCKEESLYKIHSDLLLLTLLNKMGKSILPSIFFIELDFHKEAKFKVLFNTLCNILVDQGNYIFIYDHDLREVGKEKNSLYINRELSNFTQTVYSYLNMNQWILPMFINSKEARINGLAIKKIPNLLCTSCSGRGVVIHHLIHGKVLYADCLKCAGSGFLSELKMISAYEITFDSLFKMSMYEFLNWFRDLPIGINIGQSLYIRQNLINELNINMHKLQILSEIDEIKIGSILADLTSQQLELITFIRNLFNSGKSDDLKFILG